MKAAEIFEYWMQRIVGIGIGFLAAMLLACPTSCRAPVCACARGFESNETKTFIRRHSKQLVSVKHSGASAGARVTT